MPRGHIMTDIEATVESRIQYSTPSMRKVANLMYAIDDGQCSDKIYACHRRDHHKDGSKSNYYYLELSKERFLEMGGRELE